MSVVTNIIVACADRDDSGMSDLEDWLIARGHTAMPCLSQHPAAYGGTKNLEVALFIGAFNYLDLAAFREEIASIAWQDSVQVFMMDQDDDFLEEIFRRA